MLTPEWLPSPELDTSFDLETELAEWDLVFIDDEFLEEEIQQPELIETISRIETDLPFALPQLLTLIEESEATINTASPGVKDRLNKAGTALGILSQALSLLSSTGHFTMLCACHGGAVVSSLTSASGSSLLGLPGGFNMPGFHQHEDGSVHADSDHIKPATPTKTKPTQTIHHQQPLIAPIKLFENFASINLTTLFNPTQRSVSVAEAFGL